MSWLHYMGVVSKSVKDVMDLVVLPLTEDCKLAQSISLYQKFPPSMSCPGGHVNLVRQRVGKMWNWVCISIYGMDLIVYTQCSDFLSGCLKCHIYTAFQTTVDKSTGRMQQGSMDMYVLKVSPPLCGNSTTPSILHGTVCAENRVWCQTFSQVHRDDNQTLSFRFLRDVSKPVRLVATKTLNKGPRCHSINKQRLDSGTEYKTLREK